ncbi:hypothetical protein [Microbulbifer hydrolyticus]|uniref:Uncharacterized protein n=1 Tax=Microbulbifer hydrolyticus TaxID=48074 RepID=A0A6P1T4D1_9GAMM|nr:hypothetical protein [Microbulbifer hydrolyticus]MBB5211500.1 hypothetical protein [Microbulbifer hydrolyticus]QHQ37754.1 hypothetical protein GTQ55_01295 [Microbulbifer hydrolyticus]
MPNKIDQEKLEEKIESVSWGKAFHIYEQRNEWVNWDGDTSLVNRSGKHVKLSLYAAEESAERSRLQGTKFYIAEIPAIVVCSKNFTLIVCELFSQSPLRNLKFSSKSLHTDLTLLGLKKLVPTSKWQFSFFIDGVISNLNTEKVWYKRESSPGKGRNHLAWSLKPQTINLQYVESSTSLLSARLLSAA